MDTTQLEPIVNQHLEILFEEQVEIAEAEFELTALPSTPQIKQALNQLMDMWDANEAKIAVLEGRAKPKEDVDWSHPARSKGSHMGVHDIPRDWRADVVGTLLVDESIEVEEAMPKYEELSKPRPAVDHRKQEKVRAWVKANEPEFKVVRI